MRSKVAFRGENSCDKNFGLILPMLFLEGESDVLSSLSRHHSRKNRQKPGRFSRAGNQKGLMTPMAKAGVFIDWLAQDYGLGRGHAMAIVACLRGETE